MQHKSKLVLANNELFNSSGSTVQSSWHVFMIPNPSKQNILSLIQEAIFLLKGSILGT